MLIDFLECSTTNIGVSAGGTAGAGNVALTRYNGMPVPADIWGTHDMDVDYTITDTTTAPTVPKLERGIGVITGSGTLLSRTRPRVTWNGTVFDEDLPTQLAFATAPPLGNVRIRCSPTADMFVQGPPGIVVGTGSLLSGWLPTSNLCGAPGINTHFYLRQATEYYIPYLCGVRGVVTGIAAYCPELQYTGQTFMMGIYGVGSDGLPGRLITKTPHTIPQAIGLCGHTTPANWTPRPGPLHLKQGWYYLAFMSGSAGLRIGVSSRASLVGPSPLGLWDEHGWGAMITRDATYGTATDLPLGRPAGTFSGPTPVTSLNVPTVLLSFAN